MTFPKRFLVKAAIRDLSITTEARKPRFSNRHFRFAHLLYSNSPLGLGTFIIWNPFISVGDFENALFFCGLNTQWGIPRDILKVLSSEMDPAEIRLIR